MPRRLWVVKQVELEDDYYHLKISLNTVKKRVNQTFLLGLDKRRYEIEYMRLSFF